MLSFIFDTPSWFAAYMLLSPLDIITLSFHCWWGAFFTCDIITPRLFHIYFLSLPCSMPIICLLLYFHFLAPDAFRFSFSIFFAYTLLPVYASLITPPLILFIISRAMPLISCWCWYFSLRFDYFADAFILLAMMLSLFSLIASFLFSLDIYALYIIFDADITLFIISHYHLRYFHCRLIHMPIRQLLFHWLLPLFFRRFALRFDAWLLPPFSPLMSMMRRHISLPLFPFFADIFAIFADFSSLWRRLLDDVSPLRCWHYCHYYLLFSFLLLSFLFHFSLRFLLFSDMPFLHFFDAIFFIDVDDDMMPLLFSLRYALICFSPFSLDYYAHYWCCFSLLFSLSLRHYFHVASFHFDMFRLFRYLFLSFIIFDA